MESASSPRSEGAAVPPAAARSLLACCDGLLPRGDSTWRASAAARVLDRVGRLPERQRVDLVRFLSLLDQPLVGLVLAGRWSPIAQLEGVPREQYLRRLRDSRFEPVRAAFEAIKRLAAVEHYAACDESGRNPVWPAMGYPGPISHPSRAERVLQPLAIERDTRLQCDVVVVGSGAGGGVVAGELASAGYDVVVVEQGQYLDDPDFDQREVSALARMYLDGAAVTTRDGGTLIVAGSCLGGGTVVNYTTSFRTPDQVRREWAEVTGLRFFEQDDFSAALDAVCAELGVNSDHSQPSARDRLMEVGLRRLGWHHARAPRNVIGCSQDAACGYCGFGCQAGAKRSMLKTYLRRAAQHGARLVVESRVDRVVVGGGRALGIVATTGRGHSLEVRARIVVVAGGAIGTPALLLRSGLRGQVGLHLRLHPATAVWGHFDRDVLPWNGTLQAVYSDQFANLDGGYGVKFETAPLHPAFCALGAAWDGAEHFERQMRDLRRASLVAFLTRDRGAGRVSIDRRGRAVVDYRISAYDREHVRRGVEAAARVLAEAGARRVYSAQIRPVGFVPNGKSSEREWLERVDRVGYGPNQTYYFSFHQMGSCRMGSDPWRSAVDGGGRTHEVEDLYVADASLFPTAAGTNPMITVAALGYHVARRIVARLGESTAARDGRATGRGAVMAR